MLKVRKKENGKIYLMKVLNKNSIVPYTKADKTILQKIQHPFVVKLNYAFQTETKVYLILDFSNGGELFFYLKKETRFSEEKARFYAAQIVLVLEHLHSLGDLKMKNRFFFFSHFFFFSELFGIDLAPENILLNSDGLKLILKMKHS